MTSFDAVIAGGGDGSALYAGPHGVEQLNGAYLSGNTFEVLGIDALIGRTLTSDDGKPGAPPVFVMSYKLWANRFGIDPSLIGKSFTLDGMPTTLIGVMPPRVSKLGADVWRPVVLDRANRALERQYFKFQGRLKPGVTIEQADAEFQTVAARVSKLYPRNYPEHFSAHVLQFVDSIVGAFRKTLYTMAAAVALLLLIACANVANMLLSRAAGRQRELALRTSLGASRGRLVRQLLIESLMLACVGMAVGCVFAYFGIKALVRRSPKGSSRASRLIRLDTRVLLFSLVVAGVTALVFGLVPALPVGETGSHEPAARLGEGDRRRLSRRTVEQRARRRRDRALARAPDLGRRADAQRHQAADHGAGLRAGEPVACRDSHRPRRSQDGRGTDTIRHGGAGAHSHVARNRPRREHRRLSAIRRARLRTSTSPASGTRAAGTAGSSWSSTGISGRLASRSCRDGISPPTMSARRAESRSSISDSSSAFCRRSIRSDGR